ncbi:thermonuclease family protein [Ramlibacter albus]|uniref:Thermonuclease family protein n=1 Tax=Ramlibacter albus TaxID=2079448 RepID=A0A923M798_9BURK|nr:thermonuclease family protein [Ramlibacter albus]MBC5764111.1 thermonuclease family protein [Ramlibacter albus]
MRALLMTILLLVAASTHARTYSGEVTHVTDGDTLWVRSARGKPRQVRLRGVDAPELCQPFGREARQALASRVLHQRVAVSLSGKDDYQRWLGTVRSDGEDVGAWLVAQGYAWAHRWRRQASGPYAALEAKAREDRRGLWSERGALDPRDFRKLHGKCH